MWWSILGVIIVLAIIIAIMYNSLVTLKQRTQNAWSQIDVQLQRRFDLIPNLVECVKGYMTHESETLENVTKLRTSWSEATTAGEKMKLDNELSSSLKSIMAVAESYPDLKANQNFISLQGELTDTENKISYSRQFYNDIVTRYNTKIQTVPSNIIAGILGFKAQELYKIDTEEARKSVKVDFNNK